MDICWKYDSLQMVCIHMRSYYIIGYLNESRYGLSGMGSQDLSSGPKGVKLS